MIKYHAQFLLDKEKDKPTAKLRYRIKWSGFIVAFNIGYRVEIDKWSKETQRCKINTTHGKKKIPANIINRKIQEYEQACEKVFLSFEKENKIPNDNEFRAEFNKEIGREKKAIEQQNLIDVFDDFLIEESYLNQWTEGTTAKVKGLKNHLKNFDKTLNFEELNQDKLIEFQVYVQGLKYRTPTILKIISVFKRFLKWCIKKGYVTNISLENFKPKLKNIQKKIIFLTKSELDKLRFYQIPSQKKYLERVRDIFLFQCFTGLRYSDVVNLKRTDIKDKYIEITTVKTIDNLIIELNVHSEEIINKYRNNLDEKVFPTITNQKANEYLKELAKIVGIDEPVRVSYYRGNERIDEIYPKYALLGTHAGRRTFICNALSLGIPPQVVMKWTGHSDYKAMKPYIDIADEIKISAMEKFNLL